jgi:hypothetical protein
MAQETLEARVAMLEQQVTLLMAERTGQGQPARDDWKQSVGMFRGDPIVAEMIDESQRAREEDRRRARESTDARPE